MPDLLFAAFAGSEKWGVASGGPERQAALATLGSPAEWRPAPELELTATDDGFATPLATTPDANDALWLLHTAGSYETPAVAVARPAASKFDSIRVLAAFFPGGRVAALSALRPKSGRADKEVVSVLVTGADEQHQIFDPRLSTTYDGHGVPLRVGVELWLGADEEGDQRPLRLSAESTGDRLAGDLGDLHLEAYAQRCHSRGDDGPGIYALLHPR